MNNFTGKFKKGTITISNLKTEEGEYKLHFSFDINITTNNLSLNYNFGEVVNFRMFDFLNLKPIKLIDENFTDNYIELNKEYFLLSITSDGISSSIKLSFNNFEDQEILTNFLIEFKAYCETLISK